MTETSNGAVPHTDGGGERLRAFLAAREEPAAEPTENRSDDRRPHRPDEEPTAEAHGG